MKFQLKSPFGFLNIRKFSIKNIKENKYALNKLPEENIYILISDANLRGGIQSLIVPRKEEKCTFYYPEVAEIYDINLKNFVRKLLNPEMVGRTSKAQKKKKCSWV